MGKVKIRFQTKTAQKPYPLEWHMPKALSSHPSLASKRLESKREAEPILPPFKALFVIGVS